MVAEKKPEQPALMDNSAPTEKPSPYHTPLVSLPGIHADLVLSLQNAGLEKLTVGEVQDSASAPRNIAAKPEARIYAALLRVPGIYQHEAIRLEPFVKAALRLADPDDPLAATDLGGAPSHRRLPEANGQAPTQDEFEQHVADTADMEVGSETTVPVESPPKPPRKKAEPAPAKAPEPKKDEPLPAERGRGRPDLDAWGIPIQPHALEAFLSVPKFKELISAIQKAKNLWAEVAAMEGGAFLRTSDASKNTHIKDDDGQEITRYVGQSLERAYQQAKAAQPQQTVCPYDYTAKGRDVHPNPCNTCLGRHWTPTLGKSIPPDCIERAKEENGVKADV